MSPACILVLLAAFGYDAAAPSAAQIDAWLTNRKSPLAGSGELFASLGKQYDVDPRLPVAIAGAETTFGKNLCAANNAWNWFHRRSCPPSTFDNYGEGIERVSKFMRRSYLNKGYTTIPLIQTKYCASGCQNWVPLVTRFYNEMPVAAPPPGPAPAPAPSGTAPATAYRPFGVPLWALFFLGAAVVAMLLQRLLRGPKSF